MQDTTDGKKIESPEPTGPEHDEDRRDALMQMGKFAAYTAPALLAILTSTKAHAVS